MKKGIHPNYRETRVMCACGELFSTRSTKNEIRVEICSKCHPFFTGKQKLVDTAGRLERFQRRYNKKSKQTKLLSNRFPDSFSFDEIMIDKLQDLETKYEELTHLFQTLQSLRIIRSIKSMRRRNQKLKILSQNFSQYKSILQSITETKAILYEDESADMLAMAQEELETLREERTI